MRPSRWLGQHGEKNIDGFNRNVLHNDPRRRCRNNGSGTIGGNLWQDFFFATHLRQSVVAQKLNKRAVFPSQYRTLVGNQHFRMRCLYWRNKSPLWHLQGSPFLLILELSLSKRFAYVLTTIFDRYITASPSLTELALTCFNSCNTISISAMLWRGRLTD